NQAHDTFHAHVARTRGGRVLPTFFQGRAVLIAHRPAARGAAAPFCSLVDSLARLGLHASPRSNAAARSLALHRGAKALVFEEQRRVVRAEVCPPQIQTTID